MIKENKERLREKHVLSTTLLAHTSPHALHIVRGPLGPRRIIGVDLALIPQWWHLNKNMKRNIYYLNQIVNFLKNLTLELYHVILPQLQSQDTSTSNHVNQTRAILISKAYSDAVGSWFSCELPFSGASELATPELGYSCFVLDDVN